MKRALITGITGQDGSYLAELLLDKGYAVHGLVRRATIENTVRLANIRHIIPKLKLHTGSLDNHLSLYKLIGQIRPDECYHLAASSFVSYSFEDEASIISANFNSTHYILSSIKELCPDCRFYFAGSSEIIGNAVTYPQDEDTKFNPRSMYGISKLASYHVVKNYREHHGIYACTGFTYNHESPRRDHAFVTRKVTSAVAKIYLGLQDKLLLGNIHAVRDWGYAPEYVEAAWLMLNNPHGPRDYIVATGIRHTVKDLLSVAFDTIGRRYTDYVETNEDFYRPGESVPLIGNAKRIYHDLDWKSRTGFETVIHDMVMNDIKLMKAQ